MSFFHVRRVEIVGLRYLTPGDILSRLHVDTTASLWGPKEPLARRVAGNPEIERVVIRRKLPGTLVVEVTERVPVALVPTPEGLRAYDGSGLPLPIDPARPSAAVDAPVLTQRDTALLRLLSDLRTRMRPVYDRVSSVKRVGANGSELVFSLPFAPVRSSSDVTLERLAEIEPVEAELTRRQLHVAEIDLRFKDQVIARPQ